MAWASSPTTVSPRPSGQSASRMSACRALVSWYSSTSTWSNAPATTPAASGARARARQNSSRSSRSRTCWARLRSVTATSTSRIASTSSRHHGAWRATTSDSRSWALTTRLAMLAMVSALGNRRPPGRRSAARPRAVRTRPTSSVASPASSTVKAGSRPTSEPWRRRKRLPTAWNVPPHTRSARGPTRESISAEARRLKVSRQMRSGATPRSSRWPTRAASTRVFPLPAPASTSSGLSPWCTAAPWASSRSNTRSHASRLGAARGDCLRCRCPCRRVTGSGGSPCRSRPSGRSAASATPRAPSRSTSTTTVSWPCAATRPTRSSAATPA